MDQVRCSPLPVKSQGSLCSNMTQGLSWLLQNLEFTPLSLGSVFHSNFPLSTRCWDARGKALSLHGLETPPCLTQELKARWVFWKQSMNSASLGGLAQRISIPSAQRMGREGRGPLVRASLWEGSICAEGTAEMGVGTRTTVSQGFRARQTPSVCRRLHVLHQRCPRSSGTSRAGVPGSVAVPGLDPALLGRELRCPPTFIRAPLRSPFVLAAALPLLALSSCSASPSSLG